MEHVVSALVARSMTLSEVVQNDKAIEALQQEWQKLSDKEHTEVVNGQVTKKKRSLGRVSRRRVPQTK